MQAKSPVGDAVDQRLVAAWDSALESAQRDTDGRLLVDRSLVVASIRKLIQYDLDGEPGCMPSVKVTRDLWACAPTNSIPGDRESKMFSTVPPAIAEEVLSVFKG